MYRMLCSCAMNNRTQVLSSCRWQRGVSHMGLWSCDLCLSLLLSSDVL